MSSFKFASLVGCLLAAGFSSSAAAAFVTPKMGGGQVGMMVAPMIHTDISFDGVVLGVHSDTSHGRPMLRPLVAPDEFDPAQPWSVLTGSSYNYQYAWNLSGLITLPEGAGIWIERVSHDSGLLCFKRPPAAPAYAPLFTADGERWLYAAPGLGSMTHNVYAMVDPSETVYSATYNVYLGDLQTGEPLAGFDRQTVTWTWSATVPEPSLALAAGLFIGMVHRRRVAAESR